jgi:replication-associated recombination protein RarA
MMPDDFTPMLPADLVGIPGKVARTQIAKARRSKDGRIKVLLTGPPGCGKSSACRVIASQIAKPHEISRVSAGQLTADMVRDWIANGHYRRDSWQVYHLDECDAINPTVEILMLQMLDELPPATAVLCTSNSGMGDLSERFQSRFQVVQLGRPSTTEVAEFLAARWADAGARRLGEIAQGTGGDIRAALNDLQGYYDVEALDHDEA